MNEPIEDGPVIASCHGTPNPHWRAEGRARRTVKRAEANEHLGLGNVDLQNDIRVFVAPAPVAFLIIILEFGEGYVFPVVFFCPHPVRLVFLAVPLVVIIVAFVVVFLLGRFELDGGDRHRDNQRGTHQGCHQKGLHHAPERSTCLAKEN